MTNQIPNPFPPAFDQLLRIGTSTIFDLRQRAVNQMVPNSSPPVYLPRGMEGSGQLRVLQPSSLEEEGFTPANDIFLSLGQVEADALSALFTAFAAALRAGGVTPSEPVAGGSVSGVSP